MLHHLVWSTLCELDCFFTQSSTDLWFSWIGLLLALFWSCFDHNHSLDCFALHTLEPVIALEFQLHPLLAHLSLSNALTDVTPTLCWSHLVSLFVIAWFCGFHLGCLQYCVLLWLCCSVSMMLSFAILAVPLIASLPFCAVTFSWSLVSLWSWYCTYCVSVWLQFDLSHACYHFSSSPTSSDR